MKTGQIPSGFAVIIPFSFSFFFLEEKGRGYLLMIPRAANIKCQNMWHKPVGLLFEQGNRFVSYAFFFLCISHLLPHFFYFIIADLERERARHFKNFASVILLTSSPLLPSFC